MAGDKERSCPTDGEILESRNLQRVWREKRRHCCQWGVVSSDGRQDAQLYATSEILHQEKTKASWCILLPKCVRGDAPTDASFATLAKCERRETVITDQYRPIDRDESNDRERLSRLPETRSIYKFARTSWVYRSWMSWTLQLRTHVPCVLRRSARVLDVDPDQSAPASTLHIALICNTDIILLSKTVGENGAACHHR